MPSDFVAGKSTGWTFMAQDIDVRDFRWHDVDGHVFDGDCKMAAVVVKTDIRPTILKATILTMIAKARF
jgi:hypothetical protein